MLSGTSSHLIGPALLQRPGQSPTTRREEVTLKPHVWPFEETKPRQDLQGWDGFSPFLPAGGPACVRDSEGAASCGSRLGSESQFYTHSCVALCKKLPSQGSVPSSVK